MRTGSTFPVASLEALLIYLQLVSSKRRDGLHSDSRGNTPTVLSTTTRFAKDVVQNDETSKYVFSAALMTFFPSGFSRVSSSTIDIVPGVIRAADKILLDFSHLAAPGKNK